MYPCVRSFRVRSVVLKHGDISMRYVPIHIMREGTSMYVFGRPIMMFFGEETPLAVFREKRGGECHIKIEISKWKKLTFHCESVERRSVGNDIRMSSGTSMYPWEIQTVHTVYRDPACFLIVAEEYSWKLSPGQFFPYNVA